jgi:hypothetical protein
VYQHLFLATLLFFTSHFVIAANLDVWVKGPDVMSGVKNTWTQTISSDATEKLGIFDPGNRSIFFGRSVPCKVVWSPSVKGSSQIFRILRADGVSIKEMAFYTGDIYLYEYFKSSDSSPEHFFESWSTTQVYSKKTTIKFYRFNDTDGSHSGISIADGTEVTCTF